MVKCDGDLIPENHKKLDDEEQALARVKVSFVQIADHMRID